MKHLSLALFCLVIAARAAFGAGITNAVTELTAPNTYRIAFQAAADSGDVAIYASSRADRIDVERPLVERAVSPVTLTHASPTRVYFHLKPRNGPARVVATRALPLEGGINFRDLGGYQTSDGRHVKWGMVFRSAKLDQLTERDFAYLGALNLKLVCDFRIEDERNRALTKWMGAQAPEIFFNPIDTVNGPRLARQRDAAAAAAAAAANPGTAPAAPAGAPAAGARGGRGGGGLAATYRWMAIDGLGEFGTLMKRIANGDTPMVFHCQEGRGRTGLFAALLLSALGVPRDVIMQDFLLTNDLLLTDEALTRMINTNGRGGQSIEAMRRSLAVTNEHLNASFGAIDERFPNMDAFMRDGLGMSAAEITALRTRLLEP